LVAFVCLVLSTLLIFPKKYCFVCLIVVMNIINSLSIKLESKIGQNFVGNDKWDFSFTEYNLFSIILSGYKNKSAEKSIFKKSITIIVYLNGAFFSNGLDDSTDKDILWHDGRSGRKLAKRRKLWGPGGSLQLWSLISCCSMLGIHPY